MRRKKKLRLGATAEAMALRWLNDHAGPTDRTSVGRVARTIGLELQEEKKSINACKSDSATPTYPINDGSYAYRPRTVNIRRGLPKPSAIRSMIIYAGSKENVKNQTIPILMQLRADAGTTRFVDGFLGGAGAFMSMPKEAMNSAIGIEFDPLTAKVHGGFVRGASGVSPIEACLASKTLLTPKLDTAEKFYAAIQRGGEAEKDPCIGLESLNIRFNGSYSEDSAAAYAKSLLPRKDKKDVTTRIRNQAERYSSPGVTIRQGSFINFVLGRMARTNKDMRPKDGDLLYLDPPYLGTEGVYVACQSGECSPNTEDAQEEGMLTGKFEVPRNQETCDVGKIPGDPLFRGRGGFAHRDFYRRVSDTYEQNRNEEKGKGIHIAISHSAEGRMHCLFRNAFKKAIERGDVKACRIDVSRGSGKGVGYYSIQSKDSLREQEWLMIVSPHAKTISCDEADISRITPDEDREYKKKSENFFSNRSACRAELGKAYLSKKIKDFNSTEQLRYLVDATRYRLPPDPTDVKSTPTWIRERPELVRGINALRSCVAKKAIRYVGRRINKDDFYAFLARGRC